MNRRVACGVMMVSFSTVSLAQQPNISNEVDRVYAQSEALYKDLHQHPELSSQETATGIKLGEQLKQLGFEVTTGVGGTGVVGVLKNGPGPTVLLRTELDALPVTENTGVQFASTVRTKNPSGIEVGVMHACGHDAHMAAWRGAAAIMAQDKKKWSGTLILIGQPAEETGAGAKAMIKDGLLTRFPRPDYAIAVHDDARTPAGLISYRAGPVMTNVDAVTVHIFGRGGHGARPETTIDPIVIAARAVVALQTIVSREMSPFEPAVVTVGSIHGGTTHNVIPDEVVLQLTVRSFTDEVRKHLLASIARIVKAEALAGGATKEPTIERVPTAESLVNDTALTRKVAAALIRNLGRDRVIEGQPEMVGEDFSEFPIAGIPSLQMRVGAVEPKKYADAIKSEVPLPSLHSSTFFPDTEPTIKGIMTAEVIALRELMPPRK